ncbi:MAG: hypothetical protein M3394_00475 [Actinomycetota bacterium]|nr:hypothetical protein [Actinomycetota bacterium]
MAVAAALAVVAFAASSVRPDRSFDRLTKAGAAGALSASDVPSTDPKQQQLDNAQELEGDLAIEDTPGLLAPFANSGPASDVQAVKAAVPNMLTADRAVFRLPIDEPAIADRLGAPLDAIWSDAARAVQYQEKYDALKDILQDPLYRPYSDNRFVVDSWSGVEVVGDAAFALLDGHDEFYDGAGWSADDVRQWQISLLLEDGQWKFADVKGLDYNAG